MNIENENKYNRDLLISTSLCLVKNNIKNFETGFKQIVDITFSYFDTAKNDQKNPEQIYPVEYSKLFNRVNHCLYTWFTCYFNR